MLSYALTNCLLKERKKMLTIMHGKSAKSIEIFGRGLVPELIIIDIFTRAFPYVKNQMSEAAHISK